MDKKQLEKMFDKNFPTLKESRFDRFEVMPEPTELKQFIFETIIPDVLKSMLVCEWNWTDDIIEYRKYSNTNIKRKAKILYNITL